MFAKSRIHIVDETQTLDYWMKTTREKYRTNEADLSYVVRTLKSRQFEERWMDRLLTILRPSQPYSSLIGTIGG